MLFVNGGSHARACPVARDLQTVITVWQTSTLCHSIRKAYCTIWRGIRGISTLLYNMPRHRGMSQSQMPTPDLTTLSDTSNGDYAATLGH